MHVILFAINFNDVNSVNPAQVFEYFFYLMLDV